MGLQAVSATEPRRLLRKSQKCSYNHVQPLAKRPWEGDRWTVAEDRRGWTETVCTAPSGAGAPCHCPDLSRD